MVSKDLKDKGYDKEEEFFHRQEQETIRKYKEKMAEKEKQRTPAARGENDDPAGQGKS